MILDILASALLLVVVGAVYWCIHKVMSPVIRAHEANIRADPRWQEDPPIETSKPTISMVSASVAAYYLNDICKRQFGNGFDTTSMNAIVAGMNMMGPEKLTALYEDMKAHPYHSMFYINRLRIIAEEKKKAGQLLSAEDVFKLGVCYKFTSGMLGN